MDFLISHSWFVFLNLWALLVQSFPMAIRNFNYSMAICPIFPKSDGDVPEFSKFMLHQINSKISIKSRYFHVLSQGSSKTSETSQVTCALLATRWKLRSLNLSEGEDYRAEWDATNEAKNWRWLGMFLISSEKDIFFKKKHPKTHRISLCLFLF